MSKKHFEWAALFVRATRASQRAELTEAFVALFRKFGPRFDERRFREACKA